MSGVAVVRYLLANAAAVTAIAPAAKIMAGVLPLATVPPAIGLTMVSAVRRNTISMRERSALVTERIQATVLAKKSAQGGTDYEGLVTLMRAVRRACPNQRGAINGVSVQSILPDIEGPDLEDETGTLSRSFDLIVHWLDSDDGASFPPAEGPPSLTTIYGFGAPVDGVSGTGAGSSSPGRVYIDQTDGMAYINTSHDLASPAWKLMPREA